MQCRGSGSTTHDSYSDVSVGARVLAAALVVCGTAALASTQEPAPRLNVLFIISDDLNNDIGCYGHELVRTPHIDELARRGLVFDRAYCQFTACNPSRVSILTGLYPNQAAVVGNTTHLRRENPDIVTLPQLFRQHGYFTGRVGKVYHAGVPNNIGQDGADDPESWDEVVNPRGRDCADKEDIETIGEDRNLGGSLSWLAAEGADAEQTDAIGATALIELMERNHPDQTGVPFFLAMGFYRPHTPFVAPKRYFEMYPADQIELITDPLGAGDDIPEAARWIRPEWTRMTDDVRREVVRAYYAAVSFVDGQVGRIIDALDRLGLADSTVIVFLSDHGFQLGRHGLWQKVDLFEASCRVPLIIVDPTAESAPGSRTGAITELVDLYPTLVDLCSLPKPDHLIGRSLEPILDDPSLPGKDCALTASIAMGAWRGGGLFTYGVTLGHTIRTARYRYTEWGRGGELGVELYDHEIDPNEYVNLAGDPEHRAVLEEHRAMLAALDERIDFEAGVRRGIRRRTIYGAVAAVLLALALSWLWVRARRRRLMGTAA